MLNVFKSYRFSRLNVWSAVGVVRNAFAVRILDAEADDKGRSQESVEFIPIIMAMIINIRWSCHKHDRRRRLRRRRPTAEADNFVNEISVVGRRLLCSRRRRRHLMSLFSRQKDGRRRVDGAAGSIPNTTQ